MSTRSGRTVQPTKRYRPEDFIATEAKVVDFGPEEGNDDDDEDLPRTRGRRVINNLPEALAAASKAQHETMMATLREMATQTNLLKRCLRILSETQEAILDIHEGLAIVTKDTQQQPLAASKDDIQQQLVPTLPLDEN